MDRDEAVRRFVELYGGGGDIRIFHAPGRVNLIGEHTDYNGGYVFPAALSIGTTMVVRPRNDRLLRLASANTPVRREVSLDDLAFRREDDWTNYPKGVIERFRLRGRPLRRGYDVFYAGDIPSGAGLSSSASIEVVTGYGLLAAEGETIDRLELALVCQEAENEYMGVRCGIMDQFASAMGRRGHAVLLRCLDLRYEHVPLADDSCRLVVANTRKRRGLVDSAYNERRAQCEQAVRELSKALPQLRFLGELDGETFQEYERLIGDETVRRRARHVVGENARVLRGVEALKAGDLRLFGRLMTESHESLRDLYEVSCFELDVMVEAALAVDGTLGSRMTGAGFGGCTVSLVRRDCVEAFVAFVGEVYERKTGLKPEFYVVDAGEGVRELG
ncbi:MAG: galactokinase [Candidatus Reconcilbacillus cellulovorans]|uniref:Galactokinase n=1 Tax=Candidatus Reconcilbacillus cellulovorans TaxID=1906605 RepID=A0A2A6DXG6_9BACL|nr:MAG: galactokinase [Candidatus Reconcilbacillus cellulovorans]